MKVVSVQELQGNEKLATDVYSAATGTTLMARGTVLKREYIDRLLALGVEVVRIQESIDFDSEEGKQIKKEVKKETQKNVKRLLEQHIYKGTSGLEQLCKIAENIIEDILSEDKMMESVANIRQESSDMYGHSVNVCSLATLLALKFGMEKKTVNEIAKGSILHDLGLRYITIPYENTQIGQMHELQQEEYKKHVIYGYDAVKDERWLPKLSKDIILYHHEYLNGSGYPFGFGEKNLSDEIRIVTICDSFDRMLSGIGCNKSRTTEAVEFIRLNRAVLFDEYMANLFLGIVATYPVGTKVRTNENEIGIVVRQNREFANRPVIRIMKDRYGNDVEKPYEKDLLRVLNVFIVDNA